MWPASGLDKSVHMVICRMHLIIFAAVNAIRSGGSARYGDRMDHCSLCIYICCTCPAAICKASASHSKKKRSTFVLRFLHNKPPSSHPGHAARSHHSQALCSPNPLQKSQLSEKISFAIFCCQKRYRHTNHVSISVTSGRLAGLSSPSASGTI